MELFNLQDLITEETASLDFVYLLPDMDGYLCILGHSGCQSNSFRQLTSGLIFLNRRCLPATGTFSQRRYWNNCPGFLEPEPFL